jgi:hypothetical protein
MTTPIPHAIWSGEFSIGSLTLKCHVLSDGRRVIEQESVADFMNWLEHGDIRREEFEGFAEQFATWARGTGIPRS